MTSPRSSTSFPGSLFSASRPREAEKRDPGNEVARSSEFLPTYAYEASRWTNMGEGRPG